MIRHDNRYGARSEIEDSLQRLRFFIDGGELINNGRTIAMDDEARELCERLKTREQLVKRLRAARRYKVKV
jgi:hypothetical protein|tara:strand:+ start:4758 stop:4970 length:213 start_codon:yes stop_codon:yes gene_type:complete